VGTPDDNSDADLVRAVAAGEESALRLLFERHSAWLLLRFAAGRATRTWSPRRCRTRSWRCGAGASSFRGEGDVGAWLWGIAIRQLLNRVRKAPSPVPVPVEQISAGSPLVRSAEDELLIAVEHGDVGTALRALSPELRAVLAATVIDGLSTREAARLLGLPQGTVKSRLRSAKVQLREQLIPIQGWEPR
jgi:RNA polymerase sigma-70 factor (ECF subfamily)